MPNHPKKYKIQKGGKLPDISHNFISLIEYTGNKNIIRDLKNSEGRLYTLTDPLELDTTTDNKTYWIIRPRIIINDINFLLQLLLSNGFARFGHSFIFYKVTKQHCVICTIQEQQQTWYPNIYIIKNKALDTTSHLLPQDLIHILKYKSSLML
jgi:hypothetical protein